MHTHNNVINHAKLYLDGFYRTAHVSPSQSNSYELSTHNIRIYGLIEGKILIKKIQAMYFVMIIICALNVEIYYQLIITREWFT